MTKGECMLAEYREDKTKLMEALELVDKQLAANSSSYAVLETDDPSSPFEMRTLQASGAADEDMEIIGERLFDTAFLDYGFREVRDADNIEGMVYAPIEELYSDPSCIGVAPLSFFDDDATRMRMAHGADEPDEEENPDSMRFALFLKTLRGTVIDGQPQGFLAFEDVSRVKGVVMRYQAGNQVIAAFQRTQPMWIQKKSNLLLFEPGVATPRPFSSRSLKIGTSFDFVVFGETLYFRSLRALEMLFSFNRLISQRAKDFADTLEPMLADFEKLDERIDASRGVANRVLKIQKEQSPLADMTGEELEERISRVGYYSSRVKFNEDGRVMLTTNVEVNDFLKMLQDQMLVSPLTDIRYEVRSKKRLDNPEA